MIIISLLLNVIYRKLLIVDVIIILEQCVAQKIIVVLTVLVILTPRLCVVQTGIAVINVHVTPILKPCVVQTDTVVTSVLAILIQLLIVQIKLLNLHQELIAQKQV